MNYLILTDTDFFRQINNNDNRNLRAVYNGFVKQVIELCYGSTNPQESFLAMTCAEIELQILYEHRLWHDEGEKKEYVHKAMLLVHHILELLKEHTPSQMHIPPFRSGKGMASPLYWHGSLINLMELISSLDYSELVTDEHGRRFSFAGIVSAFEKLFNVSIPKPYDLRADLSRRKKNYSVLLPKLKEAYEKNIVGCGIGK